MVSALRASRRKAVWKTSSASWRFRSVLLFGGSHQQLVNRQPPETDCAVLPARDGLAAIRREGHLEDPIGVTVEAAQLPAGLHIPQAHGGVLAAGQSPAAIW